MKNNRKSLTNNETEAQLLAWKLACNSIEYICEGEDIKQILREKIKMHPWSKQLVK